MNSSSPHSSRNPRILFFDIETTPLIVSTFRLGRDVIRYDQILKEPEVMCISWAMNDEKPRHSKINLSVYNISEEDSMSDREALEEFISVAETADVLVAHNGKGFDIPFLRSRLIKHGLPDFGLSSITLLDDTYLMTKNVGFPSHKLDYLSKILFGDKKAFHGSGMEMWNRVIRGDSKALETMAKYCDKDVVLLRKIYNKMLPYSERSLNLAIWYERPNICPSCGSKTTPIIRGYRISKSGKYPRFQCKSCGKHFSGRRNVIKPVIEFPK